MKTLKNYSNLVLIGGLILSMPACKNDAEIPVNNVTIDLPSELSMTYGEQQEITLPANITGASDVQIKLDFSATANPQLNTASKLHDKLTRAISFDKQSGKILINSTELYPNNTVSSVNGTNIPESYKVDVIATSSQQAFEGKQTMNIKINRAKINIKGLDNQQEIPFAYVLYGDAANFELEAPASISAGTTWQVENKASIGTEVSIMANQLKFSGNAGDPDKKAEKAYDLTPVLQKDGFTIASRAFRVVFIPQIKFFYGMYYSDLDLTILLNNLHIALSNGYLSSAPTLYPEKYKSSFSISSIEKGRQTFDNKDGIFAIDTNTGAVSVKKNNVLTEGAYKINVKATTTTGLEFTTSLTLNMSKAE